MCASCACESVKMDKILVLIVIFNVAVGVPLFEEVPIPNREIERHEQRGFQANSFQKEAKDRDKNSVKFSDTSAKFEISPDKAILNFSSQKNSDTKKQYNLVKISEYYDFLPRYFSDKEKVKENRYLQLEIDNCDDDIQREYENTGQKLDESKTLEKRDMKRVNNNDNDISRIQRKNHQGNFSHTLEENIDIIQIIKKNKHTFVDGKNCDKKKVIVKRDLGDFSSAPDSYSADSDDPLNNNYRYIAYVPFFKVRKYYIQRRRLDLGL